MWLTLLACRAEPPKPPVLGDPIALSDDADAVAAVDFDGDGLDELVFVTGTELRWAGGVYELGGGFQGSARGDVDGDGDEDLIVGSGMNRAAMKAPSRVWRFDADGAELLFERSGERNQVPEVRVVDGRIWIGLYAAGKEVESGWLDGDVFTKKASGALATRSLPVGDDTVYARVYGDTPKSDGDVRLASGRILPSFRGARSLALADLDGDGHDDLLVGDGWHYAYGQSALGRVALLRGPDFTESRAIAHLPNDYSARELQVFGNGWVLVTGSSHVHVLARDALGWADLVVGPVSEVGNAVPVTTPDGAAVLISGQPATLVTVN
ncbi:MAG: hypothetical protein GY913_31345 [Proteobacteria bacterium]|nr:hypothetical protein [Pseudomonadota bacterium]MCP4921415.1 hypothetical protein [Pseudomonadota bacterium]